jgi:hypothetical protein
MIFMFSIQGFTFEFIFRDNLSSHSKEWVCINMYTVLTKCKARFLSQILRLRKEGVYVFRVLKYKYEDDCDEFLLLIQMIFVKTPRIIMSCDLVTMDRSWMLTSFIGLFDTL